MAAIPLSKIEAFAYGYTRCYIQYPHDLIIQCLIRSFNGDEGVLPTTHDLTDANDASIAEEHKTKHQARQQFDDIIRRIPQYFAAQNPMPTRKQFCIEMKSRNVSIGTAIKVYQYICKVRAHPEGIKSNENNHEAILGAYQWIPSLIHDSEKNNDDIKKVELNGLKLIISKHPVPVREDIFIAKQLVQKLGGLIAETFDNELVLYYYVDISTELQRNDHQITQFTVLMGNKKIKLGVINYDLHCKETCNILYGIIMPNDQQNKMNESKCLWTLREYMTGDVIFNRFGIKSSELPRSSRQMPQFLKQLHIKPMMHHEVIDLINTTDWFGVQQIKLFPENAKLSAKSVTLNEEIWIKECKKSFQNIDLSFIPIAVYKNNKHWIEWVKIIEIKPEHIYVGISCEYNQVYNKWSVQSICLDSNDICNQHRLVGLKYNYCCNIPSFSFTKLKFVKKQDIKINAAL